MNKLIFLCLASAIVIFTVIVLNVSPIINIVGTDWYDDSCQYFADKHKYDKDKSYTELGLISQAEKDDYLDYLKEGKAVCDSRKAMVGLEYASLNINVVCGFICAILGLLLYLNVGNNIGKITGLIGLGSGAVAFVLTLVYIIESGIIFTQHVDGKKYDSFRNEYSSAEVRIDSDGAFLEWDDSKKSYVCIFYKKDNEDSLYRRYSDYGNKYLNYNSDIKFATERKNYKYNGGCQYTFGEPSSTFNLQLSGVTQNFYQSCKLLDEGKIKYSTSNEKTPYYPPSSTQKEGDCDKLFYIDSNRGNDYDFQNQYDKYVTSLVLGCFIILLDIGLAIFGFLLFKEGNGTSGPVSIK
jgi:hypothetical protein